MSKTETTPDGIQRIAREVSAKLIPHTTSVHNVDLIAAVLREVSAVPEQQTTPKFPERMMRDAAIQDAMNKCYQLYGKIPYEKEARLIFEEGMSYANKN